MRLTTDKRIAKVVTIAYARRKAEAWGGFVGISTALPDKEESTPSAADVIALAELQLILPTENVSVGAGLFPTSTIFGPLEAALIVIS